MTYPTKELRADGQRVAGADELRTCAKDPGGREQHAVQHGVGSTNGVETARRTGDEKRPTRAGNPVGRRGSEEGGPPTPSAAANPEDRLAGALIAAGGAAADLEREIEAARAEADDLRAQVENLQVGIAAERQARVRLQHELAQAAAGRPFNPEVR